MKIDIEKVIPIILKAGRIVMSIYNSNNFYAKSKSDFSPVTKADKCSSKIICDELHDLNPEIPILSEEEQTIPFEIRKQWHYFWLVDPLDGTKEFMKKSTEFTLNIALIKKDAPIIGIIYAPALDVLYYAQKGKGSFKIGSNHQIARIICNQESSSTLVVLTSRSHSTAEEKVLSLLKYKSSINSIKSNSKYSSFEKIVRYHMGSSLKFGFIAEGKADIYIRSGKTWEWDTAAGQAIVENAGGYVIDDLRGKRLIYNKKSLLNPPFSASANIF